jgi:protein ImuB
MLYPVHLITRNSFGLMTRKLSVTESQRSAQFRGTVPRATLKFVEPLLDPENLQRVIEKLCETLMGDLELRGIGERRLDLVFLRVDNISQAVRIGTSRPNRDSKHLGSRLRNRTGDPHRLLGRGAYRAPDHWADVAQKGSDVDVGSLVDTLRVRLGPGRVFRLTPVESEIPERSVKRIAALAPPNGA